MYLNIINNINFNDKRKHKKVKYSEEESMDNIEDNTENYSADNYDVRSYYSIFYGELTKTWITLKP